MEWKRTITKLPPSPSNILNILARNFWYIINLSRFSRMPGAYSDFLFQLFVLHSLVFVLSELLFLQQFRVFTYKFASRIFWRRCFLVRRLPMTTKHNVNSM